MYRLLWGDVVTTLFFGQYFHKNKFFLNLRKRVIATSQSASSYLQVLLKLYHGNIFSVYRKKPIFFRFLKSVGRFGHYLKMNYFGIDNLY